MRMRWKGTVNNYQGIICYWVSQDLKSSSDTKSGLYKQTYNKTTEQHQSVPEVLFISILTSCRWASLSHRARQAETWKDPTKKLSKGFKFHPKKSCCCWAPRVDLYQSKSIVCHEHSSVARDQDVTVTHSGSIIKSHTDIFLSKLFSC